MSSVTEAADMFRKKQVQNKKERMRAFLKIPEFIFPTTGLLADFIDYTDAITEAPKEYLLFSGIMLISSILQNKYYFVEADQQIKLNLYCILIGASTETRKTTALNVCKRILQEIEEMSDSQILYPSRCTPEAFFSLTAGKAYRKENEEKIPIPAQTCGLLTYSEFGELTSLLKKDYASGLKELLTSGYDDTLPERILTQQTGEIKPRIDFVNIFAASTPEWISENLSENELLSGFLARFIFIYANAEPDKCFPFRREADSFLKQKIINRLIYLGKKNGELEYSRDAEDLYRNWYEVDRKNTMFSDSDTAPFLARNRDHVKKLSGILQLAEDGNKTVSCDNMQRAIELIEVIRKQTRYLVNEKLFVSKYSKVQQKIIELIENKPGINKGNITRSLQKQGNAHYLSKILEGLKDTGIIRCREEGKTTTYTIGEDTEDETSTNFN